MKLNLNKTIGIGLSCLFFIFLVSCKNEVTSMEESGVDISSVTEGAYIDLEDPILADLDNLDSLLNVLKPLLLSEPVARKLDNWFDAKAEWEPAFKSTDTVLHCANIIFTDLKKTGNLSAAARVKVSIGRIHHIIGDYTVAIDHQQQALDLAQKADDPLVMGWALGALSGTFFNLRDIETGKGYLLRAIEIGDQINDPGISCLGKMGMSVYYSLLGEQDTAMVIMQEGLRIARENEFYDVSTVGVLNYTFYLISTEKYDQAIAELTGVLSVQVVGVSTSSCILHFNLFEAYIGKRDYQNALISLQKGCEQAEWLDFGYGKSFCEKSRSEYYENQGNYQLAYEAFQRYHDINANQLGVEKQRELERLKSEQTIFEKDREIERLKQIEVKRQRTNLSRWYWSVGVFGILGLSFIFIHFRNQIKLADQKKVIAESKLQVLQSQMKPHFIYNAMAGIQNYVLRSEKMEAYSYLGKFAALLRIITRTSTETHIELDREIDLIKTYLQLEKMRFREAFVYKIEVADSLLSTNNEIPSMMIQPIVENAIIHGISGLERQGELLVSFTPYKDGIKCEVRDNGRGRVAANEISRREGNLHLSIASINSEERLEFLRSMGYDSARIEIFDHYDNGEATGTSVCIYLPFRAENNLLL